MDFHGICSATGQVNDPCAMVAQQIRWDYGITHFWDDIEPIDIDKSSVSSEYRLDFCERNSKTKDILIPGSNILGAYATATVDRFRQADATNQQ